MFIYQPSGNKTITYNDKNFLTLSQYLFSQQYVNVIYTIIFCLLLWNYVFATNRSQQNLCHENVHERRASTERNFNSITVIWFQPTESFVYQKKKFRKTSLFCIGALYLLPAYVRVCFLFTNSFNIQQCFLKDEKKQQYLITTGCG